MPTIHSTSELEIEFQVEAEIELGDPGCRTLSNGDPGWPPTGPEIQRSHITAINGREVRDEDRKVLSHYFPFLDRAADHSTLEDDLFEAFDEYEPETYAGERE